jgi:class 3 adenylate cyclase
MAEARVLELERRIAELEAEKKLAAEADAVLEEAVRDRLPLAQTLQRMFEVLLRALDASSAFVRTYDETLEKSDFTSRGEKFQGDVAAIVSHAERGDRYEAIVRSSTVIAQPLDVAGEPFGVAAIAFARKLDAHESTRAFALLETWCEAADNYLASIAEARAKHGIALATSDALRGPVLDEGIRSAIEVLRGSVAFEDMLVVFRQEDDQRGVSLHYKIIQNGALTHDSMLPRDIEIDHFIRDYATRMIGYESRALVERFGLDRFREEVMINGVRDDRVVGRVIVTSRHGQFNTYERDLIALFADYLRQRVVDFNREWKHLSLCFPPAAVRRLLNQEDYAGRFLRPVEREVAVLYCDISGFTRISEQVLREPALIGKLIDTWGKQAVEILWETHGVFDKMVGDCVIGLWGPPFYEDDPKTLCRRAVEAAVRIRDFTRTLNDGRLLPELRGIDPPAGVATGLNFCPMFVGQFGPNENYTGFSSGMNNCARLQGVAIRDEILCMSSFVAAYEDPSRFGEERQAKVKNVAEPLRYRALSFQ